MKKKFKIITLGCKTNQYESQAFADQLRSIGFSMAKKEEKASFCIVNMCSVTQNAVASSKAKILKELKKNPSIKMMVAGCFEKSFQEEILQLNENIELVRNDQKQQALEKLFPGISPFGIKNFDAHTRAFVKVQDGCNNFCSYCIIPFLRGRSRSIEQDKIIQEIQTLVKKGYKEVVLTGINIGDYKPSLASLIREVDLIKELQRIRISSIDPTAIDQDLIDAIMHSSKVAKSLHLSLQSASDKIIKKMNRKYTYKQYLDLVNTLKSLRSDFTITTDIIVGFPGENLEDFEASKKMVQEASFAKVHVFPYSKRPNTLAFKFTDTVDSKEVFRRKQELAKVAGEVSFGLREQYVGKVMSVLLENALDKQGNLFGFTHNLLRVKVLKQTLKPNTLVDVMMLKNSKDGFLIGEVV